MAEEEFEESEVIFSNQEHGNNYFDYRELEVLRHDSTTTTNNNNTCSRASCNNSKKGKKKKQKKSSSLPVNIPDNVFQLTDLDDLEEDYYGEELVPPHLIVRRRIAGQMAFSVCTGNGRTLKGRDLSQVRNSILRMTGFLET